MKDFSAAPASPPSPGRRATLIRRLQRLALAGLLLAAPALLADPIITEFMASNKTTLRDADGDYSDWIELYNPDATAVSLTGWSLTDNAKKKTKWPFPAGVSLPAGGYLVVFASSKDRTDPTKELHTNFSLDADGEYLALIKPDGATATTEFAPTFPAQTADFSYGVTQPTSATETALTGYFATPTPGKRNGDASTLVLPERVAFSRPAGLFREPVALTLSGAGTGETIRYVLAPPSSTGAAVADPTATSTEYTGPITLTESTIIRAGVFAADGSRHGLFANAHYLRLEVNTSESLQYFSTRLPLIVLDDHGLGYLEKDDIDHPAWLYRFDPVDGAADFSLTPGEAAPITMSVRGTSSALFPKKSYKFSLYDSVGKSAATALVGPTAFTDWNLVGPWLYDRTFIRNALVYALTTGMGRWAPRTQLAEVFFNANGGPLDTSDYGGLYTLTDKIEIAPGRVAITSIAASDLEATAITGGYLLKVDGVDPEKYSWTTDHGFPGFNDTVIMVESPKAAKLPDAQRSYIRTYVQQLENALYADQAGGWISRDYLNYLDLPSWVDFHLLNVFVKNPDALWRSTYFSKDRGGKIVAGPVWDFDRCLGSTDGRDARWDTWTLEPLPDKGDIVDYWRFGWWGLLATDPEFMQQWVDRWQTLRRETFSDARLGALVTDLAGQIGPAAAGRDASRWPDDASADGSYTGETARLKTWIVQRAQWIDQQFLAAPALADNGDGTITLTPAPGARLVFTLDGSDPRSFGGATAASANFADAPLVIDAGAGVRARSYRAGNVTFPGSPWSSLVAGSGVPAAPRSRLVNLSTRAPVQSGDNIVIAGIVVEGAEPKSFLTRAVGPTLATQGVAAPLADPVLRLVRSDGVEIARNIGWETSPDAAALPGLASQLGAFALPAGSRDSALRPSLPAGVYSLLASSAGGHTGIGMIELYELNASGRVTNLSARGLVQPGEGALIGGFVITGSAPKTVLIRAVGPTLASLGVGHPLADPALSLLSGTQVIAANDDWGTGDRLTLTGAAAASGAFPLPDGSKDAALVTTLPAGAYTVVVAGKNTDQGVALVEIYDLP